MTILLAIQATDYKSLPDKALRWCARAGYDFRIFVPKNKRSKFIQAIKHANYHWYLAISEDQVISRHDVMDYANTNEYDLVLIVPEELTSWRKGQFMQPHEMKALVEVVGAARSEFGRKPGMNIKHFANGSVMKRVVRNSKISVKVQ